MARLDRRQETRGGGVGVALRRRIELWLAAVFMAIAFAAGFTIRAMSDPPTPQEPMAELAPAPLPPIFAPPLTDEQLQQGLPSDHPDLPIAAEDGATEETGGGTDEAGSEGAPK